MNRLRDVRYAKLARSLVVDFDPSLHIADLERARTVRYLDVALDVGDPQLTGAVLYAKSPSDVLDGRLSLAIAHVEWTDVANLQLAAAVLHVERHVGRQLDDQVERLM
jgi:hypothetical protein